MNLPEIFGYVAAGLVLATFSMRTMLRLRILGITSNVAFIIYGFLDGLYPVLVLHALLLPMNLYRFFEMQRLVREIRDAAGGDHGLHALLPYMSSLTRSTGTTLFRQGDKADDMYLIISGRIRLPEFHVEIGPGETVGEVAMFSPAGTRMTTAVCSEDCKLQCVSRERLRELVYQNPQIGFSLIYIITARLLDDIKLLQRQSAERAGIAN